MVRILLYIKHNLPGVWKLAEMVNGALFRLLHERRFNVAVRQVLDDSPVSEYTYRLLQPDDLKTLETLLLNQTPERVEYFKPHAFNYKSLLNVYNNPAFFMFGVFKGEDLAGYFFLRCFWSKKCFVGRIIHPDYEGKGIGKEMNRIMYNTGWMTGFRVLSTISRNNKLVIRSHSGNPYMVVLKELKDNYMMVEFLPKPDHNRI